ncbi:MAG: hypothetical protein ACJAVM_001139 [Sulfitobacter sp.]|jgi:uncharacterized protein YjiS (DUF1127 family)
MTHAISRSDVRLQAAWDTLRLRFARMSSAVKKAKTRRARYLATFAELSGLTDRELADIGIPRSHIRRLALEDSRMGEMK